MPVRITILTGILTLLAIYFYCRIVLGLPSRIIILRLRDALAALVAGAKTAKSWDELVLLAYQTWLVHSYPVGRSLSSDNPTPQQIEQAGLLLKSLVASDLNRPDLPEKLRAGNQEILKIDALDLGYAVRDLILNQRGGAW